VPVTANPMRAERDTMCLHELLHPEPDGLAGDNQTAGIH